MSTSNGTAAPGVPTFVRAYWAGREDAAIALEAHAARYPEGSAARNAHLNAARIAREPGAADEDPGRTVNDAGPRPAILEINPNT